MQTISGNYVTAVSGGGIQPINSSTGTQEDVFHTDATQIRSWETFKYLDQGEGAYVIQTVSGFLCWNNDSDDSWLRRSCGRMSPILKTPQDSGYPPC